tara:strand:+ start:440 stop:643 length:204 start_codon:yes stop_codon:yes gene_type:complete
MNNNMGHMNWISTLEDRDIQHMKLKIQFATDNEKLEFQGQEYSVTYLKAVVKVWETNIVDHELLDDN